MPQQGAWGAYEQVMTSILDDVRIIMPMKGRWKAADRINEFNHNVSKHYEASPTPTMKSQSFAALTATALLQAVNARIQVHSFLQTQPLLRSR